MSRRLLAAVGVILLGLFLPGQPALLQAQAVDWGQVCKSAQDRQELGQLMVLGQHPFSDHSGTDLLEMSRGKAKLRTRFNTRGQTYTMVWRFIWNDSGLTDYLVLSDNSPYSGTALTRKTRESMSRYWQEKGPELRARMHQAAEATREGMSRAAESTRQAARSAGNAVQNWWRRHRR